MRWQEKKPQIQECCYVERRDCVRSQQSAESFATLQVLGGFATRESPHL
jgi:hypothetical protein